MLSQIGVQGEHLKLYQGVGLNNVSWTSTSKPPKMQPLTWYKVMYDLSFLFLTPVMQIINTSFT